jgi:hypothetical protein
VSAYDPSKSTGWYRGDVRDTDRICHQDASFRVLSRLFEPGLELEQDTLANLAHVVGPCLQVWIFHMLEDACMVGNGVPQ